MSVNALIAQDIIKLGEKTAKKVERKVESGINRGIDKTLNDAEKEIKNSGKKSTTKDKSGSGKTSTGGTSTNTVQEKYDFKPFEKTTFSFNANNLKSQEESNKYFNQTVELVQLEEQKGKWIKLESNSAYCPINVPQLSDNWTVESVIIPQMNFEAGGEVNVGFALIDTAEFNKLAADPFLGKSTLDSLKDFHIIQLNKPNSKNELNIIVKSKKATSKTPVIKKLKYIPGDAAINKNTFAFSNSGNITKIYYCNKKITSFQNSSKTPKKIILFVLDESNESSLYLQSMTIAGK